MQATTANAERYHAFDALRAAMMLLGVVLHSLTAYATVPDVWWLKDTQTSRLADMCALSIHAFRLPAFFVMSGFFAALLVSRRGWQGFLENRVARLGLPFLLGMLVMYPFLKLASVYCWFLSRRPDAWAGTLEWMAQDKLSKGISPMHLWFLEVLMWLCIAAAALAPRLDRWLGAAWFIKVLRTPAAPVLWAIPTFLTLCIMDLGVLDTPHDFAPNFRILTAYAVFFAFGWGVYLHRLSLDSLRRGGWIHIVIALVCAWFSFGSFGKQLAIRPARDWSAFLSTAALTSLTAWFMIFGLCGIFLRRCSELSPRARYLSDSAYWLYLFHPPVLVALQIPMLALPWPWAVKCALGALLALPILLWSYDRYVRPTWLGVILNGRKHPRGFPMPATTQVPSVPAAVTAEA